MSDPISRLLGAIEAREQKALKAAPGPWRANAEHDEVYAVDDIPVCEGFALSNNQLRATVDFIADNDPSSVLRRCQADRRQVERLAEMVRLGEDYYDNPTVWDLVQDSLKDFADAYGVEVKDG